MVPPVTSPRHEVDSIALPERAATIAERKQRLISIFGMAEVSEERMEELSEEMWEVES